MVESVSESRFRQLLAEDPTPPVIDTRPAADFDSWHIPGATNLPASPDQLPDPSEIDAAIPDDIERVLTVCGWGISSFAFGEHLEGLGYSSVTVLEDGMVGWSRVYDIAEIEVDAPATIYQVQRLAKGCLGYIVACDQTAKAITIDVPIHIDEVVSLLDEESLELTTVVDTHVHADHLSGGYTLADRYGVEYAIGIGASERGLAHEHRPLADGDQLTVGELTVTALETPGHTSDMISLVLEDDAAVFTADTLFTDGVGRTELEDEADATVRARELYHSITEVVFDRADDALVLPGHFDPGGTALRPPKTPVAASIAAVRSSTTVLDDGVDAFVDRIADAGGERPPNYRAIILVNLGTTPRPGPGVVSQLELGPNRCSAST